MKFWLLGLALCFSAPSIARINCSETERFGQHLVRAGDSERKVIQAAGQPDQQRRLENRRGAAAGFRFDYYQRGQTIQVYISAGIVTRICRVRD